MTLEAKHYGCIHHEAFALMHYASDTMQCVELIWNSRDGVTPFCIRMKDGSEGRHIDWKKDRFAPNHTPKIGDRIFVNLTLASAITYRTKYVNQFWEGTNVVPPMSEMYESKEVAIKTLAESDIADFGIGTTPDLIVVDEWWLNNLLSSRPPRVEPFRPQKFA